MLSTIYIQSVSVKNIIKHFPLTQLAIALAITPIFMSTSHAAATPGTSCNITNAIGRDGGVDTAGTNYIMRCNGSSWERLVEMDSAGNVGIDQAAPAAKLHVGGEIIIGNNAIDCTAATEGGVRYNTTDHYLELCDGSTWEPITSSSCSDATPASMSFTDLSNENNSTLYTSNIVQVSGIACQISARINGEGSPELRTCADSSCSSVLTDWTNTATVSDGEYIQARLTSSAVDNDIYTATIRAGNTSSTWNVTTAGDCTSSPSVGTICADGTVYAGLSPDGNVPMYVTRCDAGLVWDGAECTGTATALPWNDGFSSWIWAGGSSTTSGSTNTPVLVAADSNDGEAGTQPHRQAIYCDNLTANGHSDWYLAAVEELAVLYDNIRNTTNFDTSGNGIYYSSTEISKYYVRNIRFSDGSRPTHSKETFRKIRCVRK